ncbi:MAG: hypothetical protein E7271_09180 [Lachnospiraceae bacterium]|jgi:flagellar basal body-associated protein FliL|nr:hypothetical protein [Lachnospiraceae bacterium]
MNKKKGSKSLIVFMAVIVVLVLGFYAFSSNRTSSRKKDTNMTEVEKLLNYNFEDNYPKTVREVVKLHCRYMKCAYNEGFTKEELYTVNKNVREIMDAELLSVNTEEAQLKGLEDDIQFYKDNKQKYVNYTLAEGSQIKYNTENGVDYARIKVAITLRVDSATVKGDQEYLLRKDDAGKWKMLGWQADKSSVSATTAE